MIANFQWAVSKLDIHICFPRRLMEVRCVGAGFVILPIDTNTFIVFKAFSQVLQGYSCIGKCRPKGHEGTVVSLLVNLCVISLGCLFYCLVCEIFLFLYSAQGEQRPIGLIP